MASARHGVTASPSPTAIRRLSRDLQKLKEEPIDGIDAMPLEENILEWHYVIRGSKGTPFEGGLYHGKLVFPSEFPWKPPAIFMFTPNGRFLPNQRLCLSISDYHPETWNPGWTVSAILVGLHSFMNESSIATGTETTTNERKKELAVKSSSFNLRDTVFCKLFPNLVGEIQSKGVEKMTDAQANEETRSTPRYPGRAMVNGDADFLQNARQHMIHMQNEMEAAMRAAMRDAPAMRAPILPDDMYFGMGGPVGVLPPPPRAAALGVAVPAAPPAVAVRGVPQWVNNAAAAREPIDPMERIDRFNNLVDGWQRNGDALGMPGGEVGGAPPPAVAVIQGFPQQQQAVVAPLVAVAGPQHPRRAAEEDAAGLDPPPPKRIPDVVTLD